MSATKVQPQDIKSQWKITKRNKTIRVCYSKEITEFFYFDGLKRLSFQMGLLIWDHCGLRWQHKSSTLFLLLALAVLPKSFENFERKSLTFQKKISLNDTASQALKNSCKSPSDGRSTVRTVNDVTNRKVPTKPPRGPPGELL